MKNYDYCYHGHPIKYNRVTRAFSIKLVLQAIAGTLLGLGSLGALIVLALGV
jgi:hypothetical protein